MLKKPNRLTSKYQFNITRKHGKSIEGKLFHLYYVKPRNYEGPSKVGIVVSNKFSKSAAKRNRLKRVFREVIRLNLGIIPSGYWVVVYPKYYSAGKKYEEICSDFTQTIQKDFVAA
jgi:ribonuclease P protein component